MEQFKANLSVLFLEDSKIDSEIVYRKLCDELGRPVSMDLAESEEQFVYFIRNNFYDVILADYTLPGFNAEAALVHVKNMCPDTPFICVSGTIGEDTAAELLKQGATDYVLKDRLGRLSFAVKRALEEAKNEFEKKKSEQLIREMNERYRLVLDSVNDGFGMFDRNGCAISANKCLTERYKKADPGELRFLRAKEVFDTEKPLIYEAECNGRWYSNRLYPVFKDGSVTAAALFSTDITDQKTAEEEKIRNAVLQKETRLLRFKELEYLEILDSSTVGTWIVDLVRGESTFSSELLQRLGCENIPKGEMDDYYFGLIHPDDAEYVLNERQKVLDSKLTKFRMEYRIKTADGGYAWTLDQGKAVYDNGRLVKIYGTSADISNRKKTEVELQRSERLLRDIIEGTDELIILNDREGRVLLANEAAARTFGLSTPELLGKNRLEYYYDKDDALTVIQRDREIMDSGRAVVIEEVLAFPSGPKTYLCSKTPWKDHEGNIIGIIVIARDITGRKAMECELKSIARELEQKNVLVTDFFINLSHEFKTPISIMLIAIELIEHSMNSGSTDIKDMKDSIAAVKQNAMRLSRLVNNLLDITKIDAGFMQANLTNEDLMQLLQRLVKSLEVYTLKKSISISFTANKKTLMMPVDKVWVDRIMLNLISNALKHTPTGGSIWVTCNMMNNKIIISVKDNGEGIPEDKKEIIFDRFRQVNSSLTRSNEGCGLGLALTKSLVEILGGRIWFESRLGEGSEFFIELAVLASEKRKSIEVEGMVLEQRIRMELSDIVFG